MRLNSTGRFLVSTIAGLFLLFLTLKLAQAGLVEAWSWWWVASPLWIPAGAFLGAVILSMAGQWHTHFMAIRRKRRREAAEARGERPAPGDAETPEEIVARYAQSVHKSLMRGAAQDFDKILNSP